MGLKRRGRLYEGLNGAKLKWQRCEGDDGDGGDSDGFNSMVMGAINESVEDDGAHEDGASG